jgi:hypothetical protein
VSALEILRAALHAAAKQIDRAQQREETRSEDYLEPARRAAVSASQLDFTEKPSEPNCDNTLRAHVWVIVVREPDRGMRDGCSLGLVCAVCRQRGDLRLNQASVRHRVELDELRATIASHGRRIGGLEAEISKSAPPGDVVTAALVDELTRSLTHLRERVNAIANGDAPPVEPGA